MKSVTSPNLRVALIFLLIAIVAGFVQLASGQPNTINVQMDDITMASAKCYEGGCNVTVYTTLINTANLTTNAIPARANSIVQLSDSVYHIEYTDQTYILTRPDGSTVGFKNAQLLRQHLNAIIRQRIGAAPRRSQ